MKNHRDCREEWSPRYDLTGEELRDSLGKVFEEVRPRFPSDEIAAAWVDPRHPFSNVLRTLEAAAFPEVSEVDEYYEFHQKYLTLLDLRGPGSVAHLATVMTFDPGARPLSASREDLTGFYTVDSLIELGNFSAADFISHYEARGTNLSSCLSVETNYRLADAQSLPGGLSSAELTYFILFRYLHGNDCAIGSILLFATINEFQASSLRRSGIEYEPLMGRDDLRTEEAVLGKNSVPVGIKFESAFNRISSLHVSIPTIELTVA